MTDTAPGDFGTGTGSDGGPDGPDGQDEDRPDQERPDEGRRVQEQERRDRDPQDDDRHNEVPAPIATAVLHHIVRSIVDEPEAVRVDGARGRNRVKLEVHVGPGDLGRVIGRRGRTAQSIRTVVRAAATRDGVDVDVDFAD